VGLDIRGGVLRVTEQLRDLLDTAVAGTRPRETDPAAAVVRRSRRGRRRTAVMASVAVVLATVAAASVGILVGAGRGSGFPAASISPGSSTGSASPEPTASSAPTPSASAGPTLSAAPPRGAPTEARVVNGRVELGGFSLAVPPGWTTVGKPPFDGCIPPMTVTVGWAPVHDGRCPLDRIISVWGEGGPTPRGGMVIPQGTTTPPMAQFTLPGGQPAFIGTGSHESPDPFGNRPDLRTVTLDMPWSNALVELNLGYRDLTRVLATVATTPFPPSPLRLHADAQGGGYFVAATDETSATAAFTGDTARAELILARLRTLTDVVAPGQECATANDPATGIYLLPSDGAMTGNELVVITETPTCTEATSMMGGRVRVPPGLVDQLHQIFTGTAPRR
jgi:hypothetical protein